MDALTRHLHIVSFDVPFPANYGGVIDVFYKLVALKAQGIRITLHCFNYGRRPAPELERVCDSVYYYGRRTGLLANLSLLPYTVKSRQSKELEQNLLKDNDPILFEVLHTCYLLSDPRFSHRIKIYRHSNIEHEYYQELSHSERSLLKKIYLKAEAWKLRRFEAILDHANVILAVNRKDADYFKTHYPKAETHYLPSFHPDQDVKALTGKGDFVLFHGNLSVSENYEAAQWLLEHVFSQLNCACIIAGLNPPAFLASQVRRYTHVQLLPSPDEKEMERLLREAQAHVLYTAQPTGLKLKLLNVLFKGRFVICNPYMVAGTGLVEKGGLMLGATAAEFVSQVNACMGREFSAQEVAERKALVAVFDNTANAQTLISAVFDQN